MIEKVLRYVEEQQMLEEGDCVVAGVSGGADSVCLLFMLLEIRKKLSLELHVVHVNHLIRCDADKDASYVEALCRRFQIPFTLVVEDVERLARQKHISTEEAGRTVRYEAFTRVLGKKKGKIAVAHHKNDSCETFLFHLLRGSSLRGLSGIRPVCGRVIRPLLCLERQEIEAFLQERDISYCIDSTNLEDNYTRNKIRHHILEEAACAISPAAVAHISSACDRISEAYDLIEDMTQQAFLQCVRIVADKDDARQNTYYIEAKAFAQIHKTLQGYVIMEVLAQAAGARKDLQEVHIRQIQALFGQQCGRQVRLPYQLCAKRGYTEVCIMRQCRARPASPEQIVFGAAQKARILAGEEVVVPLGTQQFLCFRWFPKNCSNIDCKNIPEKKYTKWLDYDRIKDNIVIRTRMPGDYLTVNAICQHKSLKAYFIDQKVPQEERDHIWMIAEGSHILWITGGRISSYYKVGVQTRHILQISYQDGAAEEPEQGDEGGMKNGREDKGSVFGAGSGCQNQTDG